MLQDRMEWNRFLYCLGWKKKGLTGATTFEQGSNQVVEKDT